MVVRGFTIAILGGLVATVSPATLLAEEIICPAVQPCDDEGNILPPFLDPASPCFPVFEMRCASYRAEQDRLGQLSVLAQENGELRREVAGLRRVNRRLNFLLQRRFAQ